MPTQPAQGVPPYWEAAKAHLKAVDPVLEEIITAYEEPPLRSSGRPFETIIRSIVGQQISAKAAASIWARFLALAGEISPPSVAVLAHEEMRAVGLSGRKAEYIHGLATTGAWIAEHPWTEHSDETVRKQLCALRGVGPWTANMVLMFSLIRPDILPLGDIGIVRAIESLYADKQALTPKELTAIAQPWSPYRTVACWYLWRHLDAEPVQY
jgi:DNA-3-methyladenine glycosylase II